MRIGLVTPYSWTVPGGVNHHIEHLAGELEARGHQVWILAPVGALAGRRARDSHRHPNAGHFVPMGVGVPIPSNGSQAFLAVSPRTVTRMDRAIRVGRFDVLHVHEPATPAVAMAGVLLATSPVVGTFHAALDGSLAYSGFAPIVRQIVDRIDIRIAVSPAARAFPAARFPGDYRIIPNGVTLEQYLPARDMSTVPGRILFIGRAERRKGLAVLLEAFARVRARLPHASLVIAGATMRQALDAARSGSGRAVDLTGVEALGWVHDDEKVAQLGAAQVVCAPSLAAESFGIVLAEAMAAGVPVVASDLPGYRSVLKDGAAGRLVHPGEPDAVAIALVDVLSDEVLRRRLSTAGAAAAAELSWRHVTDEVLAAYEDALALPLVPGVHGLPGRPWFGRALFEYVAWQQWEMRRERRRMEIEGLDGHIVQPPGRAPGAPARVAEMPAPARRPSPSAGARRAAGR